MSRRALLGVVGLLGQILGLPESLIIGRPFRIGKVGAKGLPQGIERLDLQLRGETLYVRLRAWEGPGQVALVWDRDTFRLRTSLGPLPPDSLMPLLDSTVFMPGLEQTSEALPSLPWMWVVGPIALILIGLLGGPFLFPILERWGRALYLIARWYLWLWQWRKPLPDRFLEFVRMVKALLRPHATFHPGSLLPMEVKQVEGEPLLRDRLHLLLSGEYSEIFLGQPLTVEEKIALWHAMWQALWICGRRLRPHRLILMRYENRA
ncbi:MAG: hypothetical protein NZ958_07745 [Bacteroidia bacterium]|nr:hypothetical protein [Bacteroidia bacterium]MDW8088625.1 hypothetical protein [Bacteroidia bacterium]